MTFGQVQFQGPGTSSLCNHCRMESQTAHYLLHAVYWWIRATSEMWMIPLKLLLPILFWWFRVHEWFLFNVFKLQSASKCKEKALVFTHPSHELWWRGWCSRYFSLILMQKTSLCKWQHIRQCLFIILNQNGLEHMLSFFLKKFFLLKNLEKKFCNSIGICNSHLEPNPVVGLWVICNLSIVA